MEENRDSGRIQSSVDIVENGSRHGNCKVQLIGSRDIRGHHRHDVVPPNSEGGDSGGGFETSVVSLRPSVGGVVIYDMMEGESL